MHLSRGLAEQQKTTLFAFLLSFKVTLGICFYYIYLRFLVNFSDNKKISINEGNAQSLNKLRGSS